ncbi:MAG: hypothetical protein R2882_13635 [Gemmatimonadales bacterium]
MAALLAVEGLGERRVVGVVGVEATTRRRISRPKRVANSKSRAS